MAQLIDKFYLYLQEEVAVRQAASEEGDSQEQAFTRIATEMLSESGEVEGVTVAYDEKEIGKKGQHKVNGYAMSDDYETIDLFISIYNTSSKIQSITKALIDQAVTRVTNFFRKAVYNDYQNEVAESSDIFEFAHTLATYKDLKDSLVRVNICILTNGDYKGEIPSVATINGHKLFYRVIDINYLYRISEQARVPIEIDMTDENYSKYKIHCLAADIKNEDYSAYIAIIPGGFLAEIYEQYGARLLEQNVRTFLQFGNSKSVNTGIRKTIKETPHMFLAYNNGLAATADNIDLSEDGCVTRLSNFQIVNGGQTTASIYHTWKKDSADLSNIFVQAKISVVKRQEEYSTIVSDISRFSNTQNKVNSADFSSNNPRLLAIEKWSRFLLTPTTEKSNIPSIWFFERTRGQYKNLSLKEGFTSSRKKAFEIKYPKNQVFNKYELAKYVNTFEEVIEKKGIVVSPHMVVRGNEKNYGAFLNYTLPEVRVINNVYFEDVVAKAILFKTADKLYGNKRSGNNIGEMKQVVVPYTLGLINHFVSQSGKQIDYYKIWKQQCVSEELSRFIYDLMVEVNNFILRNCSGSHYIEWAKKEDCWKKICANNIWLVNWGSITNDIITDKQAQKRPIIEGMTADSSATIKHELSLINSIPGKLWYKFADWGAESGYMNQTFQNTARDVAFLVKNQKTIPASTRNLAMQIYEIVCTHNIDLLLEAEQIQIANAEEQELIDKSEEVEITENVVAQMVAFDNKHRILASWKNKAMTRVMYGELPLDAKLIHGFRLNYEELVKHGFRIQ